MAFRWRADDTPFIAVFGSQLKKKELSNLDPLSTKLSGSAYATDSVELTVVLWENQEVTLSLSTFWTLKRRTSYIGEHTLK